MESLKVFISSYALYNTQGGLAGKWWDISDYTDISDLISDVEEDLSDRGDEDPEIMCLDTENDIFDLYSESGVDWIESYIEIMENIDHDNFEAFQAYCSLMGAYNSDYLNGFSDAFIGKYDSEEDFAQELIEQSYSSENVPDVFRNYFNYESYARDLFMDGYSFENGYVFSL